MKNNQYKDNKQKNNSADHANENGNELIFGRNPVIEALKADKLIDVIFVNSEAGGSISLICKLARDKSIPVKQVNKR